MRVTSPALVFGCLAVGVAFAGYVAARPKRRVPTTAVIGFAVIALLPATLALPQHPLRVPWRAWAAFKAPTPRPSPLPTSPLQSYFARWPKRLAGNRPPRRSYSRMHPATNGDFFLS